MRKYNQNRKILTNVYLKTLALPVIVAMVFFSVSCSTYDNNASIIIPENSTYSEIYLTDDHKLDLRELLVCDDEALVKVVSSDGKATALVELEKPIVVSIADKEYEWGWYQFPLLYRNEYGNLICEWQMKGDSHLFYGTDAAGVMVSYDNGASWSAAQEVFFRKKRYRVDLRNGDVLQVNNPTSKDITKYDVFPEPINDNINESTLYYHVEDLPEEFQGVYLKKWLNSSRDTAYIHATLSDPGLLRYSVANSMPVVWWGNIEEMVNGTLIAGIYPANYLDSNSKIEKTSVSFYESKDVGNSWKILGSIRCSKELQDKYPYLMNGFQEPAFCALNNGSFLCIMRTGAVSPMMISRSVDSGKTWSDPQPFTSNGVMPNLIQLGNGVLVLASGRPGVQLRFSFDGTGENWTEPIDMLPYMEDYQKTKDNGAATCGYASLLKADDDSFYIVYSDFNAKNELGEERKAILFRKVTIRKR